MSRSAFETRATAWLREKHDVELTPLDPRASGETRRFGDMKMPSDAGQWGYRGLVLVACAAVLSLVASRPGLGFVTERAVGWASLGALVIGLASLVVAWRRRVPSRPICVIFVPTGKARETTQMEAMKRASSPESEAEIWMMTDAAWAASALAVAAERMRCFEARGREFVEVTPTRTTGSDTPC